ncbi:Phosphoglycerate mutase family protein [Alteromonas macleodii]|jgi:hypothetical protein|uniref:phosphoglycerate mutase family protein n=2 Tax=Alteromonas TaxID=226 RepID=UPI00148CF9D1|nr:MULTISPECIES: phosphoglycerate mutase family protein [unclassified Alteromonas]MBC6986520.1 phosphoglycerate mutase family protein [Alteromonas sp. BZK5]MCP3702060.1 phosphoglycerate mutase family protein [Alteromonas sp.]MEC7285130.1 phosphoglycerate mutase family protein [Pseudomonadota bacterium]MCG7642148.1 histidine phosphatase family protein [Alteromonas sp. MmMcT2-2]MEC8640658.1 phosphoglycerate mutase family protein [Pseudomonadota bacterium]|tara:strand:- start:483 stop:1067 length:585 start_codon:yes stop_codon:yes gene_type:complete
MNMDVINNTSVKEVVLIRHGKPLSAHNDKVNSAQYAQWVRNYDKSILDPTSHPKQKTHIDDSYIVVSPLLRAKLSAAYYGATQIDEELPYLKEMDIPYYKLPFTLRSWHWVVLSRALWFIGFKGRFESFKAAKQRVNLVSERIEKLCEKHERIVLFGHGMTNYYTRKTLIKNGWQLKQKDGDFWGITILHKPLP